MADVIITLKIMPESPDVDLEGLKEKVKEEISGFGGEVGKEEEVPVAFGIKALHVTFVMDETKGSTEKLEKDIALLKGVGNCDCIDARRAIG